MKWREFGERGSPLEPVKSIPTCSVHTGKILFPSLYFHIGGCCISQTYSEVDLTAAHHVVQEGVLSHQLQNRGSSFIGKSVQQSGSRSRDLWVMCSLPCSFSRTQHQSSCSSSSSSVSQDGCTQTVPGRQRTSWFE